MTLQGSFSNETGDAANMSHGTAARVEPDAAHTDLAVKPTELPSRRQISGGDPFSGQCLVQVPDGDLSRKTSPSKPHKNRVRPPKRERDRCKNLLERTLLSTREEERDTALESLEGMNKYMETIVRARRTGGKSDNDDNDGSSSSLGTAAERAEFATTLLRAGREPAVVNLDWSIISL
mmetsp:Transcript_126810/g.355119  ORF Transcript_126810/g.355119 Transcript_126810/m.355119 type:complete len:178 (+) Transcript_126810:1-534(+)